MTAPPIAAHRLVGDGRSALLVRPDAEVDWWCAPDFDSAPVCWSLLDPRGGRARFPGARYARRTSAPAGRSAGTDVVVDGARLEVRDGLVDLERVLDGGSGVALVRLVRCRAGALDVRHELRVPGFPAGAPAWSAPAGGGSPYATAGSVVVVGGDPTADGTTLHSRLAAPAGRWAALVVAVVDGDPAAASVGARLADVPPSRLVDRLVTALDDGDEEHRRWLAGCRLPASHPQRAADALAVIRSCTWARTGAVVAAVTTSLPEAPGHDRQFDYRYSWLRDASLAVSVASLLGQAGDARRYLGFIRTVTGERLVPSGPLVDVRGDTVPGERTVPGVAGWAGSTPVRTGNDAKDQVQHDALGLLVEAVSVYVQTGGRLDRPTWRLVREIADEVAAEDPHRPLPSNGIWELREPAALVGGDVGRWLVLDRAVSLGRWRRPWRRHRRWAHARDVIGARVWSALRADGTLPQAYGQEPPRPDAAALMAVVFGVVDASTPQARRLVHATIAALEAYPFLYRYPPDGEDGFGGREGAFLPVSFWAVTALALVGDVDAAVTRLDDLCAGLPRLLSEEVDPHDGSALGNVPLVWSHAELARALYVVDAALRRRRWGVAGLWAWRLARYLALRLQLRRRDGSRRA